ncbi:MAG TPA: DNA adenine methylase [Anaerolineae bacterium]|nr:DNA adenine methylase [Anaerolineae bacterium]
MPHPIPYQGSKRKIAKQILQFFPEPVYRLVEPFAGSAAVTIAAASHGRAARFMLNDINTPLMNLWRAIIHEPQAIADGYERLWHAQKGREKEFYKEVRDRFNETGRPDFFLYLLARCVKASVRYNARGEFNQSPDNRRRGRHPRQMREDIYAVSRLLRDRVELSSVDYTQIVQKASQNDLFYLDPPYQGVCHSGDPRYLMGVEFGELIEALSTLNQRGIPYLLSYDGRTGSKTHGQYLPAELGLHRIEINAGRSAQATLLGKKETTYESLYLAPALVEKLKWDAKTMPNRIQGVQLRFSFG